MNLLYRDLTIKKKQLIDLNLFIKSDNSIKCIINVKNINKEIELNFNYVPEKSINKSIDYEYLNNGINKLKNVPYIFNINLVIDENLYIPMSKVNELRNFIISNINNLFNVDIVVNDKYILLDKYIENFDIITQKEKLKENEIKNRLFICNFDIKKISEYNKYNEIYINISDIYKLEKNSINIFDMITKDIYLYIPNVVLNNLDTYITKNIERLIVKSKGILLGNIGYIDISLKLKEKYNIELIADYSLNILNIFSLLFYKNIGFDRIVISNELNDYNKFKSIIDIELLDNISVMTTRFCLIKSYTKKCNCNNNTYYLKDSFGSKYNIITDNIDCITRLIKDIDLKSLNENRRTTIY